MKNAVFGATKSTTHLRQKLFANDACYRRRKVVLAIAISLCGACATLVDDLNADDPGVIEPAVQAQALLQPHITGPAGGPGGDTYTRGCPTNMVLIGLRGRSGWWLDSVGVVCSQYDASGQRVGAAYATDLNELAGGDGGTYFSRICTGNRAVTGITGKAGDYLDHLEVECRNIGVQGTASTPAVTMSPIGTSTGG
ncbi:MAG: hypothetical protein RL701_3258, partial [Pseudomonadota bacterium]